MAGRKGEGNLDDSVSFTEPVFSRHPVSTGLKTDRNFCSSGAARIERILPAEEGVSHTGKRISKHDGTPTSMRRTAWAILR